MKAGDVFRSSRHILVAVSRHGDELGQTQCRTRWQPRFRVPIEREDRQLVDKFGTQTNINTSRRKKSIAKETRT